MTGAEVAQHFNAKKIGKGKWMALCPSHPDRKPSLYIREGNRGVLLRCWSMGCDVNDILKSVGLTMSHLFYDHGIKRNLKAMAEFRRKQWEAGKLGRMERRQAILMWLVALEPTDAYKVALRAVTVAIEKHLDGLDPERVRMRKFHAAVERYEWDEVWRRFLLTDKGRKAAESAEVVR